MTTTIKHPLFFVISTGGLAVFLLSGCLFDILKKEDEKSKDENPKIEVERPPRFLAQEVPADNPTTVKGVELGRMLFYDPILSADSSQACSDCHRQSQSFGDSKRFSIGIHGDTGIMNTPALVNPGWNESHFWDGRASTLEDEALVPVANPIQMASKWPEVVAKLTKHPSYPKLFEEAFGVNHIDSMYVVKAIAQFERTLVSKNTKWDKVARGEAQWTDEEARALLTIFDPLVGDCFHCHDIPEWGDGRFRNIGLDSVFDSGSGRAGVTGNPWDAGKWKTPTLRNLIFTAPYMHDGRFETLEEVLHHYNEGVALTSTTDPLVFKRLDGTIPKMTEEQKQKIIFFLKCCLTDSSYVTNPEYGSPF